MTTATTATLRAHLPEYLMEAAGLGLFMVSACVVGVLLGHPASPALAALPDPFSRRALSGLAMGATAAAIIYSPWGKQSGAHLNPAVTLTFWRLGKTRTADAAAYMAAQAAGGLAGVALSALVLGSALADPAVGYVATVPGPAGAGVAAAAEFLISFLMMSTVLGTAANPRLGRFTGLFAAALVALFISLESPLSGMSMNPARTLASALPGGVWTAAWLYWIAPPLGMLAAAELHLALRRDGATPCAKFNHFNDRRCIFCGAPGAEAAARAA